MDACRVVARATVRVVHVKLPSWLTARPSPPQLVVVTGAPAMAEAAAVDLASTWVEPNHAVDIVHLRPAAGAWTVGDVAEARRAIEHIPLGRYAVAVLHGVDSLAPGAADQLLVVTERPPAGWGFVLCVTDLDALSTTLRSRATAVVEVGMAPPELAEALTVAGACDPPALAQALAGIPELVTAVLDEPGGEVARAAVSIFETKPVTTAPATTAARLVGEVNALVAEIAKSDERARLARALTAALISLWSRQVAKAVAAGEMAAERAHEVHVAIRAGRRLVRLNVDPLVAIGACLVAGASGPPER